jgi:hypothetical protein
MIQVLVAEKCQLVVIKKLSISQKCLVIQHSQALSDGKNCGNAN